MIRVVVTGSECTGKTTLAEALAAHFATVWVPEYARLWVEKNGRPPALDDVEAIAQGQVDLERSIVAGRLGLVILDTDLLSTVLYSRHYFGSSPAMAERKLAARPADLYLLAGIDVPWTPDGDQRDRGERREEMQSLFRHALVERDLPFVNISGTLAERLGRSARAVAELESASLV